MTENAFGNGNSRVLARLAVLALGTLVTVTQPGCSGPSGDDSTSPDETSSDMIGGKFGAPTIGTVSITLNKGLLTGTCTGVLVHSWVVVTAGHCLDEGEITILQIRAPYVLYRGLLSGNREEKPVLTYKPKHVFRHETADLAIVVLNTAAPTDYVVKIEPIGDHYDGTVVVEGYGKQAKKPKESSGRSGDFQSGKAQVTAVYKNTFKAGGSGAGVTLCKGDSGGPAYAKDRSMVYGTLATGGDCDAGVRKGATYVRLSEYTDWLDKESGFDVSGGAAASGGPEFGR